MSRVLGMLGTCAWWLWTRASAGVAVVLIVAAFALGVLFGEPRGLGSDGEDSGTHTEHADGDAEEPGVYTCSMHPQVRLPDADAKCPICFMDLIPVPRNAGGEGSERRLVLTEGAAARSRIETTEVGRFFPEGETRLYGKVVYDQTSVARLTAYFPGRIERLFVNYVGVPVARGDHLVEVYSPELLTAFEELRQARAADESSRGASELVRRTTREMFAAARDKLRLYGLTEAQIASAETETRGSDRHTVYAPIGGVVTDVAVREGDYVKTGAAIVTVADLSRLWLDMEAYESQLPMLRWGQAVAFTVESHPGETFEGRVSFIEPRVDAQTRSAAVRVAVDNADGRLSPGMFASAVVRTRVAAGGAVVGDELAGQWICPMHPTVVEAGPGACGLCGMDLVAAESLGVVGDPASAVEPLVVPRTAVLFTGRRSVVYVRVADAGEPTYEGREVVLGPRVGEWYVVREGLAEGEHVVTHGAFRVDSAMQIAAKPSMMTITPDGAGAAMEEHVAGEPAGVPEAFLESLTPVYAAYLGAQESLAADDMEGFRRGAAELDRAVRSVREVGLIGEPLAVWRRAAGRLRGGEPGSTIAEARARFEGLSEAVISLAQRFGHHGDAPLHITHCPMAFDFEGADWLQRGEVVNNPYFGASMLRCGEVLESLEPIAEPDAPDTRHEGHGTEGHTDE